MKQMTILFLRKNDDILLAMKKRGFGAGRWNGVGGKLEPGETTKQAVIRECQEEIEVSPISLEKVAEMIFDEQHNGKSETLLVHVYTSEDWDGEPTETEEMSPKWFKVNEIPYDIMWDDDKYWLPEILAGKKLICKFELDENDQIKSQDITVTESFEE